MHANLFNNKKEKKIILKGCIYIVLDADMIQVKSFFLNTATQQHRVIAFKNPISAFKSMMIIIVLCYILQKFYS